jgi:hypothetical protein
MHGRLNVKLRRIFIFRNVRPSIFRLVDLSIFTEESKFVVTVTGYGTCWFHCNRLVVMKRTGVVTKWKMKYL